MEPNQTSNESPTSPRSESLLEHHPPAGVSTGSSEAEDITHNSRENSRLQDEDLRHQDDETSELMPSQSQLPAQQALIDEKQRPIPALETASWYADWSIEIACTILSAAVLVGMAIFLLKIRGRLLTSWRIVIKPNTVLSILSTAFKATTLLSVASSIGQLKWIYLSKKSFGLEQLQIFDDATRGPWGALVFFWKARRYGTVIAYVGCIVTIAAIALDPFSQELLSFDPAPTRVDGASSSVPRSQIYDIPQESNPVNGASDTLQLRDTLLQQAATNGLYNSTISTAPFTCPGSNCTYPSFTSLGILGTCANVTDQTTHQCINDISIQLCNYTLPSGLQVIAQHSKGNAGGNGHTRINSSIIAQLPTTTDHMPLLSSGIVTFPSTNYGGYPTSWNDTMKAFQCDFDLVAYTYSNWTSTNGTINGKPLAWSPLNFTADGPGSLQLFNATSPEFPESENRTFAVNIYDLESMVSVLASIFERQSDDAVFSQAMYQNALYNSANLIETGRNIAMAMSLRMLQGPNATLVHGDIYEMQTYIHVHWWWLALSVALLLLACVLLGTTIALSQEAKLKAWKLSLDPLLYGIDKVGIVSLSAENPEVGPAEDSQTPRKKTIIQQSR